MISDLPNKRVNLTARTSVALKRQAYWRGQVTLGGQNMIRQ